MTAETIAREQYGRRCGAGYICRCPAHDDRSPSLSIRDCDGKVLVRCHAGCSQSDVISALRSRGLWPERERPDWTPQQRAEWARQQVAFKRDLQLARYWRRAVLLLLEDALTTEKARLFDPTDKPADTAAIRDYERALSRLRASGDAALVEQYRQFRAEFPQACAGLVRWMRERERAETRALAEYLYMTEPERSGVVQ